jgi:hypothetical protein
MSCNFSVHTRLLNEPCHADSLLAALVSDLIMLLSPPAGFHLNISTTPTSALIDVPWAP